MINIGSKEELRKEFGKDYKQYYSVKLFDEKGFTRKRCAKCGMYFWSIEERETCGEHDPYSFFKDKPVHMSYEEMWKKLADFFKKNKHKEVKRYPVVSRWRQDLYFTIAGIQDFQRIENGKMSFEYPANPLIVPQFCLRFSDIENVGVTGKHFTGFIMGNQTAFDYPKAGYWRDKTINLNYRFLTEELGVKPTDLLYHEDVWAMSDFSEFGPSLESYANGLELVNSVFTQFESVNGVVKELDGKVVDVGWGVNRLLWYYTGYDSANEAVFHNVIERGRLKQNIDYSEQMFKKFAVYAGELNVDEVKGFKNKEREILKRTGISEYDYQKKIRPMQAVYAVVDHTRTLLFAIMDGALPSNVGGGYNLRVILRRAFDFIDKYNLGVSVNEIARLVAEDMRQLCPELEEGLETFDKVIAVEKERYKNTKENSKRIIESVLGKSGSIEPKQLRVLYESHGITPELIEDYAESKGMKISIPENAYGDIIEGDMVKREKQKKVDIKIDEKIPETKKLYYDYELDAKAKVLFVKGRYVVLDRTPFYPEGGGQEADKGTINSIIVDDVQKLDKHIIHIMHENVDNREDFEVGKTVDAKVNEERRLKLIAHHTATHLVTAGSRKVLGRHVWQEGTKKSEDKGHLDISHYDKLSEEQIRQIEQVVNSELFDGIKVKVQEMERGEAESKYGFTIYQGHGVPAKRMRIVTIETKDGKLIDAEACGGLHAKGMESIIGIVKIINTYRSHDGIDRLEFVAGPAALEYFQKEHKELENVSELLNAEKFKVVEKLNTLQANYKELYKANERYKEIIANEIASNIDDEEEVEREVDVSRSVLRSIADQFVNKNPNSLILLRNKSGDIVCMAGDQSKGSAIDYVKKKVKGFKGGGSKRLAEGVAGRA